MTLILSQEVGRIYIFLIYLFRMENTFYFNASWSLSFEPKANFVEMRCLSPSQIANKSIGFKNKAYTSEVINFDIDFSYSRLTIT